MFAAAGELLNRTESPEADITPLYDALARGVIDFLTATANPDVSMEGQPAIDQLREALQTLSHLPADSKPQIAVIHEGDDQGGSRDLVLIILERVMGLPVIAVQRFGSDYRALPATTFLASPNREDNYFFPTQLETLDVNQDDLKEIVYVYEFPGASGFTQLLNVKRWDQDNARLQTLFRATLVTWASESQYQVNATSTPPTIKLTYAWFGPFDHKLLAHPNGTQVWAYDAAQDKFIKQNETVEPARTPRQQLNLAEVLFRNGDLNGAVAAYERAYTDASLDAEDFGESKADPAGFAKFRQAQVLGVLGREADARKLLGEVENSGGTLGELASAFSKSFTGKDGALRAWIAIANQGTLYKAIYESKAGNLDFPFEAREIYFEGAIVSSYLNTHPSAAQNPDEVRQALAGLAFSPRGWLVADLDGYGSNEFLFVTEEGATTPNQTQVLWLVYKVREAWRARNIYISEQLDLSDGAVPLPASKGSAVKLSLPPAFTPNQIALTWDGAHLIALNPNTLQPLDGAQLWPVVGGGVLEDDF